MISPNTFADPKFNRSNVFEKDWLNLDQVNFILEYFAFGVYWPYNLNMSEKNVGLANNFHAMNFTLNKYALLTGCYLALRNDV